jgi:hypothetical protein
MAKFIRSPFAVTGDRTAIPETVQPGGSMSWPEGFGPDYERDPTTDPDAKRIPREETNQYLFDLSDNIRQYQVAGFPVYAPPSENGGVAVAYPINAYVRWNGGAGVAWVVYYSLINNNNVEPGTDPAKWAVFDPVSLASLKATQGETNTGEGTKLAGALELVRAAREGRWTFGGAATYDSANALLVDLPGAAIFAQVQGARVSFTVPTPNPAGAMTLKVDALATFPLKANNGDDLGASDLVAGIVYDAVSTGTQWRLVNPTPSQLMRYAQAGDGAIFGYIATNTPGFTASQITMGFGNCRDATNSRSIARPAPMAKSILTLWAAGNGNGGRDQVAAFAANATIHVHAILNDTTGATDVLISASPTAPTLPGGYAYSRRVFSIILDAAANIVQFLHLGDKVKLKARGTEWANTGNGVAAGILRDVGVPKGLKLTVQFYYQSQGLGGSNPNPALSGIYDPDVPLPVFGTSTQWAQIRVQWNNGNDRYQTRIVDMECNTNAQVYTASNDTGDTIAGGVLGWWDYRGRFVA